ncbi:MAG: hypothetical protein ACOC35_13845, partial [Promethearchaeia archaeon]
FKRNQDIDIVWQWHSHPSGRKKLHEMDKRILKYMSQGVMIIIIPPVPEKDQDANVIGWYYNKQHRRKPAIKKMTFELVSE